MLDHLVDEVDGIDHVALALVVLDEDNVGVAVGVARMIRYRDRPTAADLAVTVDDGWQGRGVATALLAELVRERPRGVTQVVTTVAADNEASLALLRRIGRCTLTPAGPNRLDAVVDLDDVPPGNATPGPSSLAPGSVPSDAGYEREGRDSQ
jgi:RimJ/RimL family protein N-acetyltransferase